MEEIPDKVVAIVSVYLSKDIKDEEDLLGRNQDVCRLEKLCQGLIISRGGMVTEIPASMGLGDAFKLDIPVQEISILRHLIDQSKEDQNLRLCAGVGHDIIEAKCALEHAILDGPQSIRIYHPDMEPLESEDVKKSEEDPERQKALELLQTLKQNAQVFDRMKVEQPEMYKYVVDTIRGLIQAIGAKGGQVEKLDGMGDDIQSMLDGMQEDHEQDDQEDAESAVADIDGNNIPEQTPSQPSMQPALDAPAMPIGLNPQSLKAALVQRRQETKRPDFSNSEDPQFMDALYDVIMNGGDRA